MIEIKKVTISDAQVLALLARSTYVESHGHFIHDQNDLQEYANEAFSVSKTKKDLSDPNNLFYIVYVEGLPVGYLKLVLDTDCEHLTSSNNCRLERIYILRDFIPLKIGQQLLSFAEAKAREFKQETLWLSVYTENERAIRFYQKNEFKEVGSMDFFVNETNYENLVYSKNLHP